MIRTLSVIIASVCFVSSATIAQTFEDNLKSLIDASCIRCHDAETKTPLNMEELDYDLANLDSFRQLVRIYDRVRDREMPPRSEPRPKRALLNPALGSLKSALLEANLTARQNQRVTMRRLTRLEYEYTLKDMLGIHDNLGIKLPPESLSGSFDTVAVEQRISPIHMRTYLEVADMALDSAIHLGRRPEIETRYIDYTDSLHLEKFYKRKFLYGGNFVKRLDDGAAYFMITDWIMRTDRNGLFIGYPGMYNIKTEVYAYQARSPVTMIFTLNNYREGEMSMLGSLDLFPNEDARKVEYTAYLRPYDFFYPTGINMAGSPKGHHIHGAEDGARTYDGEGIAVKYISVEGPLYNTWPPQITRNLLTGLDFFERDSPRYPGEEPGVYDVKLSKDPIEHVSDIVARFASLAFRRPLEDGEVETFACLAEPTIAEGRTFADAARVPLLAILTSPHFLYHAGEPGVLDDFALASRLSYFLWKSMPDEELMHQAREGRLSDPEVLAKQVDRLLDDEKSMRFVKDFLGQMLRLREISATTPDTKFYQYDDVLHHAIIDETELFFAELVKQDLPVSNLIDSDFTFLNRRLAEHYGIPGVLGQNMRKVMLPEDSPRGGVLTQASILKITANGSLTSPVKRGNFVVTNLLGQPPNPPPASVTFDEPDTRGSTNVREALDKHRDMEICASCHNHIDPAGFALESFGPVGAFRTKYRETGKGRGSGPEVDASGLTEHGQPFGGIQDFKNLLLEEEDEIARHLVSQLVIYSTGGEIEFADREELSKLIEQTSDSGYPVRSIIHSVVQSNLFRSK